MFKKHDITLYCRYLNENREERLARSILYRVIVDKGVDRHIGNTGATVAGKVTLYVPKSVQSTKPYAKPKAFNKNPLESYTFKVGDKVVISATDFETNSMQALERLYDDVFTIDEIYEYDFGGLSHFEVRCK